jgi:hypothetical protein
METLILIAAYFSLGYLGTAVVLAVIDRLRGR